MMKLLMVEPAVIDWGVILDYYLCHDEPTIEVQYFYGLWMRTSEPVEALPMTRAGIDKNVSMFANLAGCITALTTYYSNHSKEIV